MLHYSSQKRNKNVHAAIYNKAISNNVCVGLVNSVPSAIQMEYSNANSSKEIYMCLTWTELVHFDCLFKKKNPQNPAAFLTENVKK